MYKTSKKLRQQKMDYQKSEKGKKKHNEAHRRYKTRKESQNKKKAVEYKGGACSKCGYNKCTAALDFHHLNPLEKGRKISDLMSGCWEKLELELNKCILLCANCHREVHHG